MMQITRQGLVMIQMFEQLRSCPYRDAAGNWTIGWGHRLYDDEYEEDYYRGEDQEPRCIEKGEATELLIEDIKTAMAGVTKHVTVPLTANQFTALVSFVFNLGEGNLAKSTLLKKLNAGDYEGAAIQFQSWTKARVKGKLKPLTGLVARRRAEELVFRSPDVVYVPAHDVWVGKPGEENGTKFLQTHPDTVVVLVAPSVEERLDETSTGDPEPDGEREGEHSGTLPTA